MSESALKAGHPPAVKAGGMRVVTKHKHEETDEDAYDQKYVDALPEQQVPVESLNVISGAVAKGNADFPTEAARVALQKPQPSKEKPHSPSKKQIRINQPRKMN